VRGENSDRDGRGMCSVSRSTSSPTAKRTSRQYASGELRRGRASALVLSLLQWPLRARTSPVTCASRHAAAQPPRRRPPPQPHPAVL
jgi:hypothetical protein